MEMEFNRRNGKVISILALSAAVLGVSIGFAAFNSQLNINSEAYVQPDSTKFDVNFSTNGITESEGVVEAIPSVATITGDDATISNTGDPSITGIKANFTAPGQSVKYSFYAHNAGEYIAYLNDITYGEVSGGATKVCTAVGDTSQSLVNTACDDINVSVKVGSKTFTGTSTESSHPLAVGAFEPVEVTITYAENNNTQNIADGDFEVEFGKITLRYDAIDK